jgi:putative transposase
MRSGNKLTIKTNGSYYLTLTVVGWIDVFTRKNHKDAIIDSLRYCIQNKGLSVYSYCLMSNHLHLVVNTDGNFELKDVIRDFKKFSAKKVINQIKNEPESRREWMLQEFEKAGGASSRHKSYKFWQAGNHAIELFDERFTWDKINYTHNNPVEEGFVNNAHEWRYSSASNYHNQDSILKEVHCLLPRLQTVS